MWLIVAPMSEIVFAKTISDIGAAHLLGETIIRNAFQYGG
jgi:hypothetical protein